jgi:LmbE family N-acetylglucosaminyl deacetylase
MNILAFGAHPDDLEPQIGGTIAKLISGGATATMVTCTTTATGASSPMVRDAEGHRSAAALGANFISMAIPESEFSASRDIIHEVEQVINVHKPNIVFAVSEHDSHQDHQTVSHILKIASRKNSFSLVSLGQVYPGGIGNHQYNYFSDISDFIEIKKKSLLEYESQINKYGEEWLEAIIARDKSWGFNIGTAFAEAAFINKWIS